MQRAWAMYHQSDSVVLRWNYDYDAGHDRRYSSIQLHIHIRILSSMEGFLFGLNSIIYNNFRKDPMSH